LRESFFYEVSGFLLLLLPHFNNSSYLQPNFSLFCVGSWGLLEHAEMCS